MKWDVYVNIYTMKVNQSYMFTFQMVGRCRLDGLEQVDAKELVFVVFDLFEFVVVPLTSSDDTDRFLGKHWVAVAEESIMEVFVSDRMSNTTVPSGLLGKVAVGGADVEALIDSDDEPFKSECL